MRVDNSNGVVTNRISSSVNSIAYDSNGNATAIASQAMTYDAENRQVAAGTTSYVYDGEGRRVQKLMGSSETINYVYDAQGQLAAEYSSQPVTGVYAINYLTVDHLGSTRLVTNGAGTVVSRYDYLPFGEEIYAGAGGRTAAMGYLSASDPFNPKFTGKERDNETGLDFFGARYFSGAQGRFTSPDSVFFQAKMQTDPQRFNLYAYTRNNPLKYVDPKGESIELLGDEEQRQKELQALKDAVGKQAGSYLYDNSVTTTDSNGNQTTNHYVGVYTNGPNGNGQSFAKVNSVAGEIAPIIADTKNVQLNVVPAGTTVKDDFGNSQNLNARTPAATGIFGGNLRVNFVDPSTALMPLPSFMMSNGQLGPVDIGIVVGHELGHGRGIMSGEMPNQTNPDSLRLENKVRDLKHPEGGQRMIHDCPPGACSGVPQ